MAQVDLHKLALRLKIIEMIQIYASKRRLQEASAYWRRLIRSN